MWTLKTEDWSVGDTVTAHDSYGRKFAGEVVSFRVMGSYNGKGYLELTLKDKEGNEKIICSELGVS